MPWCKLQTPKESGVSSIVYSDHLTPNPIFPPLTSLHSGTPQLAAVTCIECSCFCLFLFLEILASHLISSSVLQFSCCLIARRMIQLQDLSILCRLQLNPRDFWRIRVFWMFRHLYPTHFLLPKHGPVLLKTELDCLGSSVQALVFEVQAEQSNFLCWAPHQEPIYYLHFSNVWREIWICLHRHPCLQIPAKSVGGGWVPGEKKTNKKHTIFFLIKNIKYFQI